MEKVLVTQFKHYGIMSIAVTLAQQLRKYLQYSTVLPKSAKRLLTIKCQHVSSSLLFHFCHSLKYHKVSFKTFM